MILKNSKRWLLALLLWIKKANLQMPMFMPPMPPMPPMAPMMPPMFFPPPPPPPPPVPMPMPVPPPIAFQIVQLQEPKKAPTTEKNEKEEKTIGIAIPMSFPAPMQFAIPAPAFPALPGFPAPPAFPIPNYCVETPQLAECSPSVRSAQLQSKQADHQSGYQVIQERRPRRRQRIWRDKNYDRADFQSYSSEFAVKKTRRRRRPGRALRKSLLRKTFDSDMIYDDFAKPVLSYISNDGDIKLEKHLSDDEAEELMGEERMNQNVQVLAGQDSDNKQSVKVISSVENKLGKTGNSWSESSGNHKRKQVILRPGSVQHMLGEGKKELVFKPPHDKKISNLSVSFQIT